MSLHAAASGIAGRVVDENNNGVADAQVTLRTGAAPFRASTDPIGAFQLEVPPGDYTVSAEHEGYFPLSPRTVHLAEGPQELHLVLNHLREVFQSVNVAAAPTPLDIEQTSHEETLTNLNILSVPYPSTHDIRNAMKLMPGVIQDANGGLHFAGSSENQVLYTLDGFNVGDPVTGNFATRLDTDMVRSLEYSSGRYSPEFGKGAAGVLAINTEMGDDKLRYEATNFVPGVDTKTGLHLGTWTPRFGIFGPIVKGRAWFSESVDAEYSTTVVPDLPPGEQRTTSLRVGDLLRTQVNLTPSNVLFGSFLVNAWSAPETGLGALDPPSTTINQRTRTWFFSVKDQIYLPHGTLLEVGFGEDRTFARQIPQGNAFYEITPNRRAGNYFVDSTQTARRDQLISNLFLPSFHLAGTHQLKLGTDFDRLNFDQQARRTGYDLFGLGGYLLRQTTFAGSGTFSRPSLELSSYLLDSWRIADNLTAEIGVRQDWDELVRSAVLSPRLAIAWSPFASRNTKISGGYAVTTDETTVSLFARPLDQYPLDTTFNPDGSVATGPLATFFTVNHAHLQVPKYRNWTLGLAQKLPYKLELSTNWLSKRGDNGFTYAGILGPGQLPPPGVEAIFGLTNLRRDVYDSAQVTVRQPLGGQYEWVASYTWSRAQSNSVLDINVDQPLSVINNVGPLPWDSPNRFLGWFYAPTPWRRWALAGLVEARTGFPFSFQTDDGAIVGAVDSHRYPMYFNVNLHIEYRFRLRGRRLALRGGFNNITNHKNYTVVNNVIGAPSFLTFYGSDGRHFVLRLRFLGKE
jgi:outer membrane receptor protein involved in Fe transport